MTRPSFIHRVNQLMSEKGYSQEAAVYAASLEVETQAIKKKSAHKVRRVKK